MLTGAASICTIKRLLLMCFASPVARPPDPIAMRCANSMEAATTAGSCPLSWQLAAWLSAARHEWIHNHVVRNLTIIWSRVASSKVAPQVTMTGGWPTVGDHQGRVRVDLSLLFVRSAAPEARTGWGPLGPPCSCELSAVATSPCDLLRAGACAWRLSCCSAIRLPACSPGASLAFRSTHLG